MTENPPDDAAGLRPIPEDAATCYGKLCPRCESPCALRECGIDVVREKKEVLAIAHGNTDSVPYSDGIETVLSFSRGPFPDPAPDSESRSARQVVARLVHLYLDHPAIFDMLVRRVYLDWNQTDYARWRGVTRAAVSKSLREGVLNMMTRELGLRKPVARRLPAGKPRARRG